MMAWLFCFPDAGSLFAASQWARGSDQSAGSVGRLYSLRTRLRALNVVMDHVRYGRVRWVHEQIVEGLLRNRVVG